MDFKCPQRWQFCHPEHGIDNHIDKTRRTSCESSQWFQISSHVHTALAKIDKDAEASTVHNSLGGCFTLSFAIWNKNLKDVQVETCLKLGGVHYLEHLGKPHLLCVFCRNQVCKTCRWKHVLHVFEVIKMIKSRVSVFFIYLYPYLRACQWTVGTWITFDRRNWQDTSFASNFGLACIWNFVSMFHIFTHIYTCMFHIFWIVQKYIDLYVYIYIYTIYDWFISLFFTDNTNTGEHTLIMDLNHIVNILCCRDVFRSHISEGSCRHGKNGRQGELRFLPQKT